MALTHRNVSGVPPAAQGSGGASPRSQARNVQGTMIAPAFASAAQPNLGRTAAAADRRHPRPIEDRQKRVASPII
jgi:hypothetical protein